MKYEVKTVNSYNVIMFDCPHCKEDQEIDSTEFNLDDGQWIANYICFKCDKESIVLGGIS